MREFENMNDDAVEFGKPSEQRAFNARHQDFVAYLPSLEKLGNAVFNGKLTLSGEADLVICLLGGRSFEEFNEILLLCANGYGIAAMRLLRGLFETALTARFLHVNPERIADYLDFATIDEFKFLQAKRRIDGESSVDQGQFEAVRKERDAMLSRYTIPCKKCGEPGPAPSWFRGGVPSMVDAVGPELRALLLQAYYEPTRRIHASVRSILERMQKNLNGSLSFDVDSQHRQADWVICTSHGLLLSAIELQVEHFGLKMEGELQIHNEAFTGFWRSRKGGESESDGQTPR